MADVWSRVRVRTLRGAHTERGPWHARVASRLLIALLGVSVAGAVGASLVAGAPSVAVAAWLAGGVLVVAFGWGPKGVVPAAAGAAAVLVLLRRVPLGGEQWQALGVTAASYLAFGLLAVATFHSLFRQLNQEHSLRLTEVETERNRALHLVHEREQLQHQLAYSATHDPLTGLANRALLMDRLRIALCQDTGPGRRPAVMFIDLDDFKTVNDLHGHAAGDDLLRVIAGRLTGNVRSNDLVARLGGDEFAILFTDLPADFGQQLLGRILEALRSPAVIDVQGTPHQVPVAASAGLVIAQHGDEPLTLIGQADLAMYSVKDSGKGGIKLYEPAMQERVHQRMLVATELDCSVEQDQLRAYYQPIVCLSTGRLLGFEALVRWQHPTRGMVPPDEFIAVAESTGVIQRIGLWMLDQACMQLRQWDDATHRSDLTMAVNVSARQLSDPHLSEHIQAALHRHRIDPRRITLEITESLAMDDDGPAMSALWQLKTVGVRLAMDDFGTGYSSLSRLGNLPLDKVKIDKAFVQPLSSGGEATKRAATMIRASIAMAKGLDLLVVAEGIEQATDVALLRHLGCDQGQGYLFARPLPAEEIDVARLHWALPQPDDRLLSADAAEPERIGLMPAGIPQQRRRLTSPLRVPQR